MTRIGQIQNRNHRFLDTSGPQRGNMSLNTPYQLMIALLLRGLLAFQHQRFSRCHLLALIYTMLSTSHFLTNIKLEQNVNAISHLIQLVCGNDAQIIAPCNACFRSGTYHLKMAVFFQFLTSGAHTMFFSPSNRLNHQKKTYRMDFQ